MKRKIGLALLVLSLISALAFCVSAQVQSGKQQEEVQKMLQSRQSQNQPDKFQEERQQTVRKTMLVDKVIITLFQAKTGEDGKSNYFQIIPPGGATPGHGTLRITLMDGSVQEIPILRVKEVTIEQERLPAR